MSDELKKQLEAERNLSDELAAALGGKGDAIAALRRYADSLSDLKDKIEVIRYSEMHVGGWRSMLSRANDELEFAESLSNGLAADSISDARARIFAAKLARERADLTAALVREVRALIERLDDYGSRTEKVREILKEFA